MSRAWKNVKKYERWVLIAIVVLLLATFSVTGITGRGCSKGTGQDGDMGGSFESSPGHRESVSDTEFRATKARYERLYRIDPWGPSHRYMSELSGVPSKQRLPINQATWIHIATVGAARAAGYRVGKDELRVAVEDYVIRAVARSAGVDPRQQGVRFVPELYDQVIERVYQMPKTEFETTVGEILLKDKFLEDLVDTSRFSKDRQEAYDAWKDSRERVDLAFAAVPAAQFKDAVEKEEATRSAVAAQADLLEKVGKAVGDVRRLTEVVKDFQVANKALPADVNELTTKDPGRRALNGKMPLDPWGKTYVFAKEGETFQITSEGPDGTPGNADDVGTTTLEVLNALGVLRRVGDALVSWHGTTNAWPAALLDMTKAPVPADASKVAPPPPLPSSSVLKDPWARDLVYEATGPLLLSTGPDGVRGTPDDLAAEVTPAAARVPLPAAFAAYRLAGSVDAWGRPLDVQLKSANPLAFSATSLGEDGVAGGDDVQDGNATDLQSFYNRVRLDFRLPQRREFEAVYVIPALVSDEAFAEAWKRFPQYRPEEQEAWDLFRQTAFYARKEGEGKDAKDIDPADPEKGYAASLVADLKTRKLLPAEVKPTQVPSGDTLGDRKDLPAAAPGLPTVEKDPLFKTYVEKGWRRVVLRDQFFEKALNDMLKTARESAEQHAKWDTKEGRAGPEPVKVTFDELLAKWKDLQPGAAEDAKGVQFLRYFRTEAGKPLSRQDWEALPLLGDYGLSAATGLSPLKDGQYAAIPTLLHGGALRAALHSVKLHEQREPELAEVREKVWPRYLETRQLERAAKELELVRAEATRPAAATPEKGDKPASPEDRLAQAERLLKEASEKRKFTYELGRTGPFIGSARSGRPAPPPTDATADQKLALLRRAYVRKYGYDEVRSLGSVQGVRSIELGALGRRVLRDQDGGDNGTKSAYLVQVAWRANPSPEEFTGKQYVEWLGKQAYGTEGEWVPSGFGSLHRPGYMNETLGRFYEDWDALKRDFSIESRSGAVDIPLEIPTN